MKTVIAEIASLSGARESCEIKFVQGTPLTIDVQSHRFGAMCLTGENLFDALCKLRLRLEGDGYLLLCNAARRDAYPSRMVLQMGQGVYLLKPGVQAKRENLVDLFGFAPIDQVCSVAEQRENYEIWIKSLK